MFCGIVFVFLGKILSGVGKHGAAGVFFGNLAFIAATRMKRSLSFFVFLLRVRSLLSFQPLSSREGEILTHESKKPNPPAQESRRLSPKQLKAVL